MNSDQNAFLDLADEDMWSIGLRHANALRQRHNWLESELIEELSNRFRAATHRLMMLMPEPEPQDLTPFIVAKANFSVTPTCEHTWETIAVSGDEMGVTVWHRKCLKCEELRDIPEPDKGLRWDA